MMSALMAEGERSDVRAPDGTRLAVYEWGDPSGPEILLIHGFAQSHLCFEPQVRSALASHCRVIAFDMRGHGSSAQPADTAAYRETGSGQTTSPQCYRQRNSRGPFWSDGRWVDESSAST